MIYLDNAATSFPKPESVCKAMAKCLRHQGANPGRAGYRMSIKSQQSMNHARSLLARLFHADDPNRFVFTLNATDALNMAIKGVLPGQGEHVITSVLEHNSVLRPLYALEAAGKIRVTRLAPSPDGLITAEDVKGELEDDTQLVALTHCSNVLGLIEPIEEIAAVLADHPALFLVDAAQTAGSVEIDLSQTKIDLLAFAGHKGLMGPTGTGALYVREPVDVRPWREGGTGEDSAPSFHPEEMPYRLEAGTPNTVGICGLAEGLEYVMEVMPKNILKHEQELAAQLIEFLQGDERFEVYGTHDAAKRTGLVSFNLKGMAPQELASILDVSFDIAVRAGLHCAPEAHRFMGTFPQGAVRVSPGLFNTESDIELLIRALDEVARSL